jgi:hypothetical protein
LQLFSGTFQSGITEHYTRSRTFGHISAYQWEHYSYFLVHLSLSSQNIAAVFWHVSVWHHRTLHVFQNFRAHFSLSVGTLQLFSGAFESIITEYCSYFLARFCLASQNITSVPELSGTFQPISGNITAIFWRI